MWCRRATLKYTSGKIRDFATSRGVAKFVNSVFAFGAKSSVHFLASPFATKPATLGFGGVPDGGLTPPALRATSPYRGGFRRKIFCLP